ncbi:MAG: circularly permuted type 2 ATP-grasp protein [Pseudomonas sp.]
MALAGGHDERDRHPHPRPHNETYYEHAWIARYLGVLLLEGEDLTVRNGRAMVRTVAGLQPIEVLWRRLDAAFMDPLELRPDSWIGTPGFVGVLREGGALALNALGSGLLESRALQAFLPGICRALTGQELKLPGIATWWCGQAGARDEAVAQLPRMMLGPALSTRLPYGDPDTTVHGDALDPDDRVRLLQLLREDGAAWVAQETVTLSTTPTWVDGQLEARPFVLRCFAARTAQGWEVMPGGFARIGAQADTRAIAMQRGGQAADVWIVAEAPVQQDDPADGRRRAHAPAQPRRRAAQPGGGEPAVAGPLQRARRKCGAHPARLPCASGREPAPPAAGAGNACADSWKAARWTSASRSRPACCATSTPPPPAPRASATASRRMAGRRSTTSPAAPTASPSGSRPATTPAAR